MEISLHKKLTLPNVNPPLYLLSSGKVDEKATQLHAIASLKVLLEATRPTAGGAGAAAARHSAAAAQAKETPLDLPNGGIADVQLDAIEEVRWFALLYEDSFCLLWKTTMIIILMENKLVQKKT